MSITKNLQVTCMIYEHLECDVNTELFEDTELQKADIVHLAPIFDRLALPQPLKNEVMPSHEKGFHLFLNDYAVILRFAPRDTYLGPNYPLNKAGFTNLYHEKALPYIGLVHYPKFTFSIMPGIAVCDDDNHALVLQEFFEETIDSCCDCEPTNTGYLDKNERVQDNLKLLDTNTYMNDFHLYHRYLSQNQQAILDNFKHYSALQKAFHDAWIQSNPENSSRMDRFWNKTIKQYARLFDGWNEDGHNNIHELITEYRKPDFQKFAKRYQDRIAKGQQL